MLPDFHVGCSDNDRKKGKNTLHFDINAIFFHRRRSVIDIA